MAGLSLAKAWDEAAAFVKREARLLFPIAFLLIALPLAAASWAMPETPPGQLPPGGLWIALLAVALVVGMIGNLAISFLALRPGVSVGEALARGARRFLPMFAAFLLVLAALCLALIVIAVLVVLLVPGAAAMRPGQPPPGAVMLAFLVPMAVVGLFLSVRMLVVTPVAAAEEGGPFAIIGRSWSLTGPNAWTLLGFVLLAGILVLVVNWSVSTVSGIAIVAVAGPLRPGSLSALLILLIGAVVSTLVSVFLTTIIARIYAQLAGEPSKGI